MIKTREIKHSRLKQIVENYSELQSWLVNHRKVLELLKKDHELLTSELPYKIHFAVDFREIYQMIFPLGSEREIKELEDCEKSDWLRHKVVSQLGRICLFYGLETSQVPVLLPPYRNQLEDFSFRLKKDKFKTADLQSPSSDLLEKLQTTLLEEVTDFKRKGKHFEIPDEDYDKFVKVIKNNFFPLSMLLMGSYSEAFSILHNLSADKRIDLVSHRWSEYLEFINREIQKVPDEWFGFLRKYLRENPLDSEFKENDIKRANSKDITTLHLIKELNKKFKAENKKEIVLLVSDAEIFKELLNNTLSDDKKNNTIGGLIKTATGEEIEILRTTDVFHTYLLIKKEREELKSLYKQKFSTSSTSQINKVTLINVENDLHKIKLIERFKSEINQIIEFCNKNRCDCLNLEDCLKNDICLSTENVIENFQEDRKVLESLALAEMSNIYAKIYKHYQQVDVDELLKEIFGLLQNDEKIGEIISKQLEETREHINRGFEELTINSIVKSELEPNVLIIPRGNSFRIKTYEEEIDEIIHKIQRSIRQNDQESFSFYFSALKDKRNQIVKSKSLEYFLSSLISAAYEKYDLSLYFLERGLIFTGEKNLLYKEFKYLEAIIYCNDRKFEEALIICKELLAKFQNDARLHYFCGYIILSGKDHNKLEEYSYEEAVCYCRDALSIFKKTGDDGTDLILYILNNLIYGLAKIGTSNAIEEAEQSIVELGNCSNPEYDWGEHIYHTVGYVFFRKAEILKINNEDYSNIINKAIKNFEIATNIAGGKNPIIKNDLRKVIEIEP